MPPSLPDTERTCWVCLVSSSEDNSTDWIRACHCKGTLAHAHEHCLLNWVQAKQSSVAPDHPVACPVCGFEYQLVEPNPGVLFKTLNASNTVIRAVTPYVSISLVGISTYVLTTTHGVWSLIQMLGGQNAPEVQQILFSGRWNWRTWLGLPLIPISLVAARFSMFDHILPFMPMVVLGGKKLPRLSWPPSTSLSLLALPWVVIGYRSMRQWLFSRYSRSQRSFTSTITENIARMNNNDTQIDTERRGDIDTGDIGNNNDDDDDEWITQGVVDETVQGLDVEEAAQNPEAQTHQREDHAVVGLELEPPPMPVQENRQDVEIEIELSSRSNQQTIIGSLLLPGLCAGFTSILQNVSFIKPYLPRHPFHQNLLSGAFMIVSRDILSFIYHTKRQRLSKSRHIKPCVTEEEYT